MAIKQFLTSIVAGTWVIKNLDDGVHLIRVALGISRDSIALRLIRFKL